MFSCPFAGADIVGVVLVFLHMCTHFVIRSVKTFHFRSLQRGRESKEGVQFFLQREWPQGAGY